MIWTPTNCPKGQQAGDSEPTERLSHHDPAAQNPVELPLLLCVAERPSTARPHRTTPTLHALVHGSLIMFLCSVDRAVPGRPCWAGIGKFGVQIVVVVPFRRSLSIQQTHRGLQGKNSPKLEVLAPLQRELLLRLAGGAFLSTPFSDSSPQIHVLLGGLAHKTEDNLLGGLRLLVEDGLGLTTITGLLAVVTALALREGRSLTGLVLGDLVQGVLAALAALAEGLPGLGNVHHFDGWIRSRCGEVGWSLRCRCPARGFSPNLRKFPTRAAVRVWTHGRKMTRAAASWNLGWKVGLHRAPPRGRSAFEIPRQLENQLTQLKMDPSKLPVTG